MPRLTTFLPSWLPGRREWPWLLVRLICVALQRCLILLAWLKVEVNKAMHERNASGKQHCQGLKHRPIFSHIAIVFSNRSYPRFWWRPLSSDNFHAKGPAVVNGIFRTWPIQDMSCDPLSSCSILQVFCPDAWFFCQIARPCLCACSLSNVLHLVVKVQEPRLNKAELAILQYPKTEPCRLVLPCFS